MKPTELDESLLTAYLDDELSHDERVFVEEQLKGNERWQQLLSELESVRDLIQRMPKPILSRPIANGPWNDTQVPQLVTERDDARPGVTKSWFSIGQLALAASLLVGGFVTIAILRSEKSVREMAKIASPSTASSSSETAMELETLVAPKKVEQATPAEMARPAMESEGSRVPLPTEKKKLKLRSALPAGSPNLPEAVETFYVKYHKLASKGSDLNYRQQSETVELSVDKASPHFQFSEQRPNDNSKSLYFWTANGPASTSSSVIEFVEDRKYDFCFQRSDWPAVEMELRNLGIELPSAALNEDAMLRASLALQKEPKKDEVLKLYPPTLMAVIGEPTDWIRVVVTVEGSDTVKAATEFNK